MRCQVTANSQAKLFAVVDFEYMPQSIRVFNGRKGISESMVKLGEIIDICSETSKQWYAICSSVFSCIVTVCIKVAKVYTYVDNYVEAVI